MGRGQEAAKAGRKAREEAQGLGLSPKSYSPRVPLGLGECGFGGRFVPKNGLVRDGTPTPETWSIVPKKMAEEEAIALFQQLC